MTIKKKPLSKLLLSKKSITLVAVLVVVIGLYFGAAVIWKIWPMNTANIEKLDATRNEKTTSPSPKNPNPPSKQDLPSDSTTTKTTDQVPVSTKFVANITQLEEKDGQVNFNATIQNTSTAGTCVVTYTNPNDRPVVLQFAATNTGSTSTCGPRSVSANEFSYLGDWQVTLRYYAGDQQALAQGTITIK